MKRTSTVRTIIIGAIVLLVISCIVVLILVQSGLIEIPNPHDVSAVFPLMCFREPNII